MEPQITQNTQRAAVPYGFKAKLAEVEQQTEMQARMRSYYKTMSPNLLAQRMIRLTGG
jgi:hypothetical protein